MGARKQKIVATVYGEPEDKDMLKALTEKLGTTVSEYILGHVRRDHRKLLGGTSKNHSGN